MKNISLEKSGLKGEFEVRLLGPDNTLKDYRIVKNLTVNKGFSTVCDLMGSPTLPPNFRWCAIGTGTAAPVPANTLLAAETARVLGGYTKLADTIWKNDATFGPGVGSGSITESGLFNSSTFNAETMLCRQTFAVITKGAEDTLVVTWQYTLS